MFKVNAGQVFQALGLPAILVDPAGLVAAASPQAQQLFPELVMGQPIGLVLRDPDLTDAIRSVAAGAPTQSVELSERVPVERLFRVQLSGLTLEEKRSAVVMTFDDLTASRATDRMRVDFIANASHELRTPLASMLGFVETLQGAARHDVQARERFLGIMRDQGLRMSRLIDDLLSLSRIEMKAHLVPDQKVDLSGIIKEIVNSLSLLAVERETTIAVSLPDMPAHIAGDRDELLRMVENLIENAIKYGRHGGKVSVTLALGPSEMLVTVTDDGPGIASEHLPRLTERFYRVNTMASREAGGTGLGLAIVKHIVLRHRGRLSIESKIGQGTCMEIQLPRLAT